MPKISTARSYKLVGLKKYTKKQRLAHVDERSETQDRR
jgi:hypothetical protein